jgi:hypothetical protein
MAGSAMCWMRAAHTAVAKSRSASHSHVRCGACAAHTGRRVRGGGGRATPARARWRRARWCAVPAPRTTSPVHCPHCACEDGAPLHPTPPRLALCAARTRRRGAGRPSPRRSGTDGRQRAVAFRAAAATGGRRPGMLRFARRRAAQARGDCRDPAGPPPAGQRSGPAGRFQGKGWSKGGGGEVGGGD